MNELIQSKAITELKEAPNVQYVLEDEKYFSLTEYKVLKNQDANFIKCARVTYNGKIKLIYFTTGHKSFKNMIPTFDEDTFLSVLANVFNTIIQIKNNGFLSCPNLDLSFDKIFVDPTRLTVSLIYLPVNNNNMDSATFENEFKTETIKLISGIPTFNSEKLTRVCGYLSNGTLSLEELYKSIASEIKGGLKTLQNYSGHRSSKKIQETSSAKLALDTINSTETVHFEIDRTEYIIGRNVKQSDGVISFNKAVGRTHCKIVYQDGKYSVVDLASANGTFVNGQKAVPSQPVELKDGDVLRIANIDFKVGL